MATSVSIVICTRNRLEALKQHALPSIEALIYPCFEVVIVDDCSSDGTQEFLSQYIQRVVGIRVVRNERSKGLCHARNIGVRHSKAEIIAFMDDDCAVSPHWLTALVNAYNEAEIAVVGGISFKGDTREIYINDHHAWGCNMSFRASIFQQFEFDEGLRYSHYADETDIIGRILAHGYKRVIAREAVANHYVREAAYRKQQPLSAYLNYHYMNAKKTRLKDYYKYVFTHSLKHVALVEYGLNFQHQPDSFVRKCLAAFQKTVYYLYVLLLEIPVSAKIRHAQEEALVHQGRSRRAGHPALWGAQASS